MSPRTEELLYFLLWTATRLARPSWRNLNDSFETWAWRNGLGRRLAELARQKLIERHPEPDLNRIVRLTEFGRQSALGGRDPELQWNRPWDGAWRLVLFDIPVGSDRLRQELLRLLHRRYFGYLQKSVWITPDPTEDVRQIIGTIRVQADAFLVIEGQPAAGESDAEIVAGAWDFAEINKRYEKYHSFVRKPPPAGLRFVEWARSENVAWKSAVGIDPLLPARLLPPDYRGRDAYRQRQELSAKYTSRLLAAPSP